MSKPDWLVEGANWPLRDASRFVTVRDLRWHVQILGKGPPLLLVHGTGAATHSWRGVAPLLAERFTVIAPDLPGHGFTDTPRFGGLGLPVMAKRLGELLVHLEVAPLGVVGHSAGAAVAVRMVLDGYAAPKAIVSINGALEPFPGMAGFLFPFMAQALFLNPLAVRLFAWRAQQADAVPQLMRSTGSRIDEQGVDCYRRLLATPGHIEGALGMMSAWNLEPLQRDLPRLTTPLTLIVGMRDATVPPGVSEDVAHLLAGSKLVRLAKLGHLAHEEAPAETAAIILDAMAEAG